MLLVTFELNLFVSGHWSLDLIEGHLECEKHAVMLGCLCKPPLREDAATHLQKGDT